MCLAQGHNAVMPLRLEPATPQSQVKHSTTEPLHSPIPPAKKLFFSIFFYEQLKSHVHPS